MATITQRHRVTPIPSDLVAAVVDGQGYAVWVGRYLAARVRTGYVFDAAATAPTRGEGVPQDPGRSR